MTDKFIYLFIYLFGAKKADRFAVVTERVHDLMKKYWSNLFYAPKRAKLGYINLGLTDTTITL